MIYIIYINFLTYMYIFDMKCINKAAKNVAYSTPAEGGSSLILLLKKVPSLFPWSLCGERVETNNR